MPTASPTDAQPPVEGHQPPAAPWERAVRAVLRDVASGAVFAGAGGEPLTPDRLPEGGVLRRPQPFVGRWEAVAVPAVETSAITAFLDGIQRARLLGWVDGGPVIVATVAATVRWRVERRFVDGGTLEQRLVLAPPGVEAALARAAQGVAATVLPTDAAAHPDAARASAFGQVSTARAALERRLAEQWCSTAAPTDRLVLDGGLAVRDRVATDGRVIGVVKSHGQLYADGDARTVLFGLPVGARTRVFPHQRHADGVIVGSWYLRLHASPTGDPLGGLVRVEQAASAEGQDAEAAADVWAAWLLVERQPLARPDARWDRLLYGVAACERYLAARLG